MMDDVRRKDLGNVGTRSLALCEACGSIVPVAYHHQARLDLEARMVAAEFHRKAKHPSQATALLPLAETIWGIGKVPRMRKR